jgi:hypothetical protein
MSKIHFRNKHSSLFVCDCYGQRRKVLKYRNLAGVIGVLSDDGVPVCTDGDVRRAAKDDGDDDARRRRSLSKSTLFWVQCYKTFFLCY